MKSLQVLQNKIAKEILDRLNYSSAIDALTNLSYKPLEFRKKFHRCIFMYKCLNNMTDCNFDVTPNNTIQL